MSNRLKLEEFEAYDTFQRVDWPVQVGDGGTVRRTIEVTRIHSCDHGHETPEAVRLSISEDSDGGMFLCAHHWREEMSWRVERNRELGARERFDLYKYPGKAPQHMSPEWCGVDPVELRQRANER